PAQPVEPSRRPDLSAPSEQGKWNPERERRPMNPVPRERLPYPDLPVQRDDRPLQRDMPRDDRPMGRPAQSREPVARTVIDRDSQFDGNFRSDSDLLIEGTFEGEIDCKGTV